MTIKDRISTKKIDEYYAITNKALQIAKKSLYQGKKAEATKIFVMVEAYLSDSLYFKKKGDYVNSFGAINYAHGWLDSGAQLKIFKVNDNTLFSI